MRICFHQITTGSKRGLDTRVSLKQALAKQGLMSAKTYKNKLAEPLVQKLKSLVKTALIRCFEAYDSYYRLNITNSNLHRENEKLTKTNEKLAGENENLRAENKNYKLLKKAFGSKQMYSLPELALPSEKEKPIGIWGQRHLQYLKEYKQFVYLNLLTSGRYNVKSSCVRTHIVL